MRPPFRSNNQSFGTANVAGKQNLFKSSSEAMFNNLWVGSLAADVTDSDLRNLFEQYGVVDSITCYPARSYAFVYMNSPEDAKRAKESLQGFLLRGGALKIAFSKPARPCKSLWISGISVSTSKEDLEEEFSKFGKIEDFKFIKDKNTAYIDYARLEDASKALKIMHGKYRGGSVLRVDYLRSHSKRDQGPDFRDAKEGQNFRNTGPLDSPWLTPDTVKNFFEFSYNGPKRQQHIVPLKGQKRNENQPNNVLIISYPPIIHINEQMLHNAMILFGEIDNIRNFPSQHYSLVEFRSVEEAQLAKDGLQGRLFNDPRIIITFSNTFHGHDIPIMPFAPPDSFDLPLHGPELNVPPVPNWKRSPGTLHREPKRIRTDVKDQVVAPDPPYGGVPQAKGVGRLDTRLPIRGSEMGRSSCEYIWRGVIAKGGSPVCRARCVPIRDWIGYDVPEVINCSARTGLDTLSKHYNDAIDFDIVFFLPDSEEDFASYTEFIRYLGDRNRAGVAKFNDGTTLFLVPPSDFLSNVLNVSGPERLYGVVLKFPKHPSASSSSVGPVSTQPQYIDKQEIFSRNEYDVKVLEIDYSGVPHEDEKSNIKSTPQTGISLTPELIATLASLAKGKLNSQQPSGAPSGAVWEYGLDNPFHGQPEIVTEHQGYQSNVVNDSRLTNSVNFPPQSGHFAGPMQPSQHYVPSFSQDPNPDSGSVLQTEANIYGSNVYESQSLVPAGHENAGPQLQSTLFAASQQPSDFDADKNERYQSTLQFATNLLLQIHQQQPGTQSGQGGSLL